MNSSILNRSLSVFIPFYNEELALESSILLIREVLRRQNLNYEILLVNDGSDDRSPAIAERLVKADSQLKLIRFNKNEGFGRAYLTGIKSSRFEHCLYLTADGDVNAEELELILTTWDGKRPLIQYALNPSQRSSLRFVVSQIFTKLVNLLTRSGWPYYNGFNIYVKNEKIRHLNEDFGFCTQAYVFLNLIAPDSNPILVGTVSKFNDAESKAVSLKNFLHLIRFFIYIMRYKR